MDHGLLIGEKYGTEFSMELIHSIYRFCVMSHVCVFNNGYGSIQKIIIMDMCLILFFLFFERRIIVLIQTINRNT